MDSIIYLAKPTLELSGCPNGIKKETISISRHLTDIWEMSFEVERYINDINTEAFVESDFYHSINIGMNLFLDSQEYSAFFIVDKEPTITLDGNSETKSVTCHSIESGLQSVFKTLSINTGIENISAEYLADGNIDEYTQLPKEYISLVNYSNHQLSLMHLILDRTGWDVDENIKEDICNRKYSFELDDTDIYSFLTQNLASTCQCFVNFDRKHKKVSLIDKEDMGIDTNIFLSYRNLLDRLNKSPVNNELLVTKYYPAGRDGLGVFYANFGQDFIIDLDYYANAKDEYGNYKYVNKALSEKYADYVYKTDVEKVTYEGNDYTRRELYMEYSRLYNELQSKKSELINRVPCDGCLIDYTTYKYDELILTLKAYNNALLSLISLYKQEYGVDSIGDAPDYLPAPSDRTNIKDTIYWYDFDAYNETIIPKLHEALKIWCKTNANGDLCDANGIALTVINENTVVPYGDGLTTNPAYNDTLLKDIDAYLYDFSLYGLDELNAKRLAWMTVADTLYTEGFITGYDANGNPVYNTPDLNGWNALGDSKKNFTNLMSYQEKLNLYLDYMAFHARDNSITGKSEKGIVRQCEDAISLIESEIAAIDQEMEQYDISRKDLSSKYTYENFFPESERNALLPLIRESNYANENIITTNLDDLVTIIDRQNELYLDAKERLYTAAHPQWHFDIESANLFALNESIVASAQIKLGNYIRVQTNLYKDEFVRLRLIAIRENPCEITDHFEMEFSDITISCFNKNDFDYIFSKLYQGSGSSSGSSSGSGTSSGGTYGSNDANIQISNNMLNALLSSDKFGTAVTDVVLDRLTGNKANFQTALIGNIMTNSVTVGNTVIDGECLTTGKIKSLNYKNGTGSLFDLDNGTFESYAANGNYIKNNGTTLSLQMSNFSIDESGNAKFKGDISGSTGTFAGAITAKSGSIGGYNIGEYNLVGSNVGISSRSGTDYAFWAGSDSSTAAPFRVGHNGEMYASNASISGNINGSNITSSSINNGNGAFSVDVNGNCFAESLSIMNSLNIYTDYSQSSTQVIQYHCGAEEDYISLGYLNKKIGIECRSVSDGAYPEGVRIIGNLYLNVPEGKPGSGKARDLRITSDGIVYSVAL